MKIEIILVLISALSFFYYGLNSLFSKKMVVEYNRWGFEKYRKIIGSLQFLASLGLLAGFYFKVLISIVSFLLFIMMVVAIFIRVKVNDSIIETLPATMYAMLNLFIFYVYLKQ